ncbi:MAG TPA: hypothetical protein VJ973_07340, partial [Christiangramia sp.]|nr:hypothetical protein [Christiangramia sp.]
MKIPKYLPILLFILSNSVFGQRLVKTINSGWEFQLEKSQTSKTVNIPHTWNAEDAFQENAGYFRGKGIYKRKLSIPAAWKDQSVFLKFQAANQVTRVFIDNKLVGEHIGGYTAFVFELSEFLKFG